MNIKLDIDNCVFTITENIKKQVKYNVELLITMKYVIVSC